MTDREQLGKAIQFIAWGYVLLYLDINLGPVNILPNWLGFLLILRALPIIAEEVPSAALLRPLCSLLATWDGIQWLATCFGITTELNIIVCIFTILTVIASVAGLYFHFQLLTDLATMSEQYNCPRTDRLLRLRTVNTLITTVFALPLPWETVEWLAIVALLVFLFISIWICVVLFSLKGAIMEREESQDIPFSD